MAFGGCYLRDELNIESMPLKSVRIEGVQRDLLANFEITQIFSHSKPTNQQVSYIFPNDQKFCIYDATFVVGKEIIKPTIKSKEEAKKIYDEAVSQGKTAVYGSNVRNSMSEFKLGNLPPDIECKVILKVALFGRITSQNSYFIKFPIDIYTPSGSRKCLDVKASDFNFELKCDIEKVEKVTSNVKNYNFDEKEKLFSIKDKIENRLDENSIIITFETKERLHSSALVDTKTQNNYNNYLVTFSPTIEQKETNNKNNEFVFFVDCSGSMSGTSIKKAAECLEVFIRSLPLHSYYNIIRFGSDYEKLFDESVEYNQETVQKGLDLISNLYADLGGTELVPPLKDLFQQKCKYGQRQIFIITDGEVWSVNSLLELISENCKDNRCFTIGIGRGCDAGLVEGIARVSNGKCGFVQEGDSISEKVIPQLESSLLPFVESIEVHIGGEGTDSFEVSPYPIQSVCIDDSKTFLIHCKKSKESLANGILVTASYDDKPIEFVIDEIVEAEDVKEDEFGCSKGKNISKAIFPLFVFNLIQDFELKKNLSDEEKAKIINLSIDSGVLCTYTGYVGVVEPVIHYEEEEEMQYEFDGGLDECCCGGSTTYKTVEVVRYAKVISDGDSVGNCSEEEEVEMAGGFDDLFDGGSCSKNKSQHEDNNDNNDSDNDDKNDNVVVYCLMNLIKLQKFEGYWDDLDKLNKMCNSNVQKIDGISLENKDLEKKCISTVLAIAALHVKSQNEKNTWSMIERKAISWLKSNIADVDIVKIIEQTEDLLRTN